jgi:hypothetical protein
VPFKVVIDEAIELACRHGTDASGRFVNGYSVHRTRVGGAWRIRTAWNARGRRRVRPGRTTPIRRPARPAADRVL